MGWNSPGAAVAWGAARFQTANACRVESIRSASEVHVRLGSKADNQDDALRDGATPPFPSPRGDLIFRNSTRETQASKCPLCATSGPNRERAEGAAMRMQGWFELVSGSQLIYNMWVFPIWRVPPGSVGLLRFSLPICRGTVDTRSVTKKLQRPLCACIAPWLRSRSLRTKATSSALQETQSSPSSLALLRPFAAP